MEEKMEVLMSCMYQDDASLVKTSNLENVNVLMINQCDVEEEKEEYSGKIHIIKTNTRGLSVSRNLAIKNAKEDICLFSDDDEVFVNNLEEKILSQYKLHPEADMIIFKMIDRPARLGNKEKYLRGFDFLKLGSWQISFRRNAVLENKILFDPKLGAGSGNGVNEENKFVKDCMKAGMKILYVPIEIASAVRTTSTWFSSFDAKYFYNRGRTTRYILGTPVAMLYAIYFLVFKRYKYKKDISVIKAGLNTFKGIFGEKLQGEKDDYKI